MRQLTPLRIPGGLGTLNASRSPLLVKNEDLVACESLTYEHDTWQKDGGATLVNTLQVAGAPSIIGLWDFTSLAGVQELVGMTGDGKLATLNANGIDKTLKSGLTANKMTVFAEGISSNSKYLFLVNGWDTPQVYSGGASSADIASPAADWVANKPSWAFLHNNRMVMGGNTNRPYTTYHSVLDNHQDFVTTGPGFVTFTVYPGEGERIVGGISWRGRAYFFKYPRGIYYLDDSDPSVSNWGMRKLSRYVGIAGPGCLCEADDEVYFISTDGYIHALSAVNEYGDAISSAVDPYQMGTFIRENVNLSRLDRAQSCWYANKRKILWGLSGTGSLTNNIIVGLDLHRIGQPPQGFTSTRDESEALCISRDVATRIGYPLAGTTNGYVYKLDAVARDKNGSGYMGRWETRDLELYPGGIRRANLKELQVEFAVGGSWNLTMDIYRDGTYSQTVNLSLSGQGGVLGSFVLGTNVLGVDSLFNNRAKLFGDARRVKTIGYNANPDESFSVAAHSLLFTAGNDR